MCFLQNQLWLVISRNFLFFIEILLHHTNLLIRLKSFQISISCYLSFKHQFYMSFQLLHYFFDRMLKNLLKFLLQYFLNSSFNVIINYFILQKYKQCVLKNSKNNGLKSKQEELLRNLYTTYGPKKWKRISKEFKKQGFRRKQLEIRQKWINHMNPSISNDQWSQKQLEIMYKTFDDIGSKWCIIQQSLQTRTQIKIKNKFYGNIRVFIRFVLLYFQGKNCKNKRMINRIPPNILNQIYKGQKGIFGLLFVFIEFQFFNKQFHTMIFLMNFNIDKKKLEQRIIQNTDLYENFSIQINELFKQLKATQQFKLTFQQNESYYSEISSSQTNKKIATKGRIKTSMTFKTLKQNKDQHDSQISIKKQQQSLVYGIQDRQLPQYHPQLTSIIQIQPRQRNPFTPLELVNVYYAKKIMIKQQAI